MWKKTKMKNGYIKLIKFYYRNFIFIQRGIDMNFVNFETQEQFKQLQKNNVVIVKWKKSVRQYKELGEITYHNSYTINRINELILKIV